MDTLIRLHIQSLHPEPPYDLETMARLSGVHPALIAHYIQLGLLDPVEGRDEREWHFDDHSLFMLRKIQRLRDELGVNLSGVGVVLELLEEIEELQRELSRLRIEPSPSH